MKEKAKESVDYGWCRNGIIVCIVVAFVLEGVFCLLLLKPYLEDGDKTFLHLFVAFSVIWWATMIAITIYSIYRFALLKAMFSDDMKTGVADLDDYEYGFRDQRRFIVEVPDENGKMMLKKSFSTFTLFYFAAYNKTQVTIFYRDDYEYFFIAK